MHPGKGGAVGERKSIRSILAVKGIKFVVIHLHRWCVGGKECTQIGNPSKRSHRAEQRDTPIRARMRMPRDSCPNRGWVQAAIAPIKPVDKRPAFLVGETVQVDSAHLVTGSAQDTSRLVVLCDE